MATSPLGRRRFPRTTAGAALATVAAGATIPSAASAAPRRRGPAATFRWSRPDVAMIAVRATDTTHAYVPRLLAALDWPATVVPVHWDDFQAPLPNPPSVLPNDQKRLDAFLTAVRKVAPRTNILLPEYLTPYTSN